MEYRWGDIAFSVLIDNGILWESGLAAVPIVGIEQKGFVVTKGQ